MGQSDVVRVVFFGTPGFAVPTLRRLAADRRFEVVLVVSQPDRPAGRGRRLAASAVTEAARELGLPVYQPASLREPEARRPLAATEADLVVVAAYGMIFGAKTLALPRLGCVNVHASLLPRYRGASPIPAAILAGDAVSGVSLMRMELGLDTGPILAAAAEPIRADDTAASLGDRLALAGADLAAATLPRFATGEIVPVPQPATGASRTRPLTKGDGWLDWSRPAAELERRVRAMWPWPRAWSTFDGKLLQVHAAEVVAMDANVRPGRLLGPPRTLTVACGQGALRLTTVQPAGGRPMPDTAFLAGSRDGEYLGEGAGPPRSPLIVDL